MIEKKFEEVHSKLWFTQHEINETHELWVVRQVIPWQKIIDKLVNYYAEDVGRLGINLRTIVAVSILQKLRKQGDQAVIVELLIILMQRRYWNMPVLENSTRCLKK